MSQEHVQDQERKKKAHFAHEKSVRDEIIRQIFNQPCMKRHKQSEYDKWMNANNTNNNFKRENKKKEKGGKDAEKALEFAHITVNKNMVPFDDKSPFVTSGIRIGTPAITTRGLLDTDMPRLASLIDRVITNYENEDTLIKVKSEVNDWMSNYPLFSL